LNKKILVIIMSSVVVLTVISGVVFIKITRADGAAYGGYDIAQAVELTPDMDSSEASDNNSDYTYIPPTPVEENILDELASFDLKDEEPFIPATEMDLDPTSITVFVNKEYDLPKDYKPENMVTPDVVFNLITYDERTLMRPEAAVALEKLFNAAKRDGIILYGISGFRSYERQYKIFTNNIVNKGKKYTLRYSAVPGTSEHQTGLAIDVSAKSLDYKLSSNFASSPEGLWLAENAHNYGYIIRYPEGNEKITGYAFEPWHIRYLGKGLATYLYTNELTLEEYYHYSPSPDFDFETLYADIINYIPPVISGIPIEGEGVIIGENGEIIDGEADGDLPEDIPGEEGSEDGSEGEDTLPDGDITGTPIEEVPGEQEQPADETVTEDEDEDPATQDPDNEIPNEDGIISPTPTPTPTLSPTPTPEGSTTVDASGVFPSDQTIVNE
jgi:D-alanyl-D-alanine carboxypeptidase